MRNEATNLFDRPRLSFFNLVISRAIAKEVSKFDLRKNKNRGQSKTKNSHGWELAGNNRLYSLNAKFPALENALIAR